MKSSPIWEQYQTLKRQHPDTVLFFRLGDFYETFGDDAKLVARELGITLTSRPVARGARVPMAGVPQHSVDTYLARLLASGHRVARAEQLADQDDVLGPQRRSISTPEPKPAAALPPEPPQEPTTPASLATQLCLPL